MNVESSSLGVERSGAGRAVFLSYASQDVEAAKRIADALRSSGVEVWFDAEGGLEQGDEWDAKIRRQIKECVLFIAVVSANTEAREEGYFRIEWDLAAERARGIASGVAFILPVVIDATKESTALVPDRFRAVQWTKLPGGVVPPDVLQRFLKLWSHRTGVLKHPVNELGKVGGTLRPDGSEATEPKTPPFKTRTRLTWVTAAVVAVLLAAALGWRFLQRSPGKSIETPGTPMAAAVAAAAPKSSAPLTEAQKLTQQARNLIDDPMDMRENYFLADEFARRAVAADPADGEAWAVAGRISALMVSRKFDTSPARKEQMRMQVERAMSLAPKSTESALALAARQNAAGHRDEAHRILEDLAGRVPTDPRVWERLGDQALRAGHEEEAIGLLQRAQALSGPNGRAGALECYALVRLLRLDEARKKIDQALAAPPARYAYYYQLLNQAIYFYQVPETRAFLEKIPAQVRQEDSVISTVTEFYLRTGEGDRALDELKRMPRDFFEDGWDWRPKGYLAGYAHRIAGRAAAAQAEWKESLAVVEKRLAAEPNKPGLLYWRCVLQALTGQVAEAREGRKLLRELDGPSKNTEWFDAILLVALGEREAAIDLLVDYWPKTSLEMRNELWGDVLYAPWFAALRDEPRLRALALAHKAAIDQALNPAGAAISFKASDSAFAKATADASGAASAVAQPMADRSPPDPKSVAVLAFANLSDDKANEYFSDGITEELLNLLTKVPGLKVSARTSAFYFKNKEVPVPEIARQLGVAYVVEGSVRKQGDKVRITAQLIKAADGFQAWSDTFTRDLKDIFALQDEIAGIIARNLSVTLAGPSQSARAINPEAHRLVLEGRHFWNLRTADGFDRAEGAFRRAIALDPEYASAHAGLANVLGTRLAYRAYEGATDASYEEARAEAQRAIALDPADAQVYMALGIILNMEGRLAEAGDTYRKAKGLNPNYALAHHWLSLVLELEGRIDEALAEIGRAVELDPLSGIAVGTQARMLQEAGRYADAFATYERAAAILPDRPSLSASRAVCLLKLNRRDEAVEWARKVAASTSRELRLVADADAILVLRQTGHETEAAAHAERIRTFLAPQSYQHGAVLAAMGRFDEALPYLGRTPNNMIYTYYWNAVWDAWRDDPRFIPLMEKLGWLQNYRTARETLARLSAGSKAGK